MSEEKPQETKTICMSTEEICVSTEENLRKSVSELPESDPSKPGKYSRLFTASELESIRLGYEKGVDETVNKELEDALLPVSDADIKLRIENNRRASRPPKLADLSVSLEVPVSELQDNQLVLQAGDEEEWKTWFAKRLKESEVARKANRDFKNLATVNLITTSRPEKLSASRQSRRHRGLVRKVAYYLLTDDDTDLSDEEDAWPLPCLDSGPRLPKKVRNIQKQYPVNATGDFDALLREAMLEVEKNQAEILIKRAQRAKKRFKTPSVTKKVRSVSTKSQLVAPLCHTVSTVSLDALITHPDDGDEPRDYVDIIKDGPTPPDLSPENNLSDVCDPPEDARQSPIYYADVVSSSSPVSPGVCAIDNQGHTVVKVNGIPVNALIDTGAQVTLLHASVFRRFQNAPTLRPVEIRLNGVTGHQLDVLGTADLELVLQDETCRFPVHVTEDLHVDFIMGLDLLRHLKVSLDLDKNVLQLSNTAQVLPIIRSPARLARSFVLRLKSSVRLRPGGQALVTAVCSQAVPHATVLIEGLKWQDTPVRVANTLCSLQNNQVLVEIMNASLEDIWIRRGKGLAKATVLPPGVRVLSEDDVQRVSSAIPPVMKEEIVDRLNAIRESGVISSTQVNQVVEEMVIDFSDSSLSLKQREMLRQLLLKFSDIFVTTSKMPGRTDLIKFGIDTGDARPVKQQPYRVSKAEADVMEAEIQQYLELGLIRQSVSPWASPVLMIRKPDGGIRFCIDYRKLNALTVKDCYPMPLIDDLLDVLSNAKLFSTMDIASGYWNVPMEEDSIEKTAFTCKFGLYEWLVMPFGLCNAVPCFERLMENVLVDLKWRCCLVYLDDCVVFSEDFPSHLERVRLVLERFRSAGFKLKMSKCKWGKTSVAFLGHIVTPQGVLPNPEKVQAVLCAQRPRDLTALRAFLGLSSYFRRYIKGYAIIAAPLEELKQKEKNYEWTEACEEAFVRLQTCLATPPILAYPDFTRRFKLYVDASVLAVGACLMQELDGKERVIAYASKTLTSSQKNWINHTNGISEIECWGVVWSTRKFRCYLDKHEFDLYTDHKALTWIFGEGSRTGNSKLARWAMELSQLNFKIHYRPGDQHGNADGLSRMSIPPLDAQEFHASCARIANLFAASKESPSNPSKENLVAASEESPSNSSKSVSVSSGLLSTTARPNVISLKSCLRGQSKYYSKSVSFHPSTRLIMRKKPLVRRSSALLTRHPTSAADQVNAVSLRRSPRLNPSLSLSGLNQSPSAPSAADARDLSLKVRSAPMPSNQVLPASRLTRNHSASSSVDARDLSPNVRSTPMPSDPSLPESYRVLNHSASPNVDARDLSPNVRSTPKPSNPSLPESCRVQNNSAPSDVDVRDLSPNVRSTPVPTTQVLSESCPTRKSSALSGTDARDLSPYVRSTPQPSETLSRLEPCLPENPESSMPVQPASCPSNLPESSLPVSSESYPSAEPESCPSNAPESSLPVTSESSRPAKSSGDSSPRAPPPSSNQGLYPTSFSDPLILSADDLKSAQQDTPWMVALMAYIQDGALALDNRLRRFILTTAARYSVRGGILFRRVTLQSRLRENREKFVPVIPLKFIPDVLHKCHSDVLSAHLGREKTLAKVQSLAYWLGWRRDVCEFVKRCTSCNAGKSHRPWYHGAMQRMQVYSLSGPFSLLVVDGVGPLPTTSNGYRYIIVFVDYFTRWPEAFAVRTIDTATFVKCLTDGIVCRYGVPERLLSDRGAYFISELANAFYSVLGIKKLTSSAYHPQTQGLVERFNGTLMKMLMMYVNDNQDDWDVYLPRLLFAYRTSHQDTLGDSPFFCLFGRDPVLPLDLAFGDVARPWVSSDISSYKEHLYESFKKMRRLVERQHIQGQNQNARRLQKQKEVSFAPTDRVWVHQEFRRRQPTANNPVIDERVSKLAFHWHGPYRIVNQVNPNTYRIEIPSHPDKIVAVNVNRLRRFKGFWSRPYNVEVPGASEDAVPASSRPSEIPQDALTEDEQVSLDDLPSSSFVESLSHENTDDVMLKTPGPAIQRILSKEMKKGHVHYLVLFADDSTRWIPRTRLSNHLLLIDEYESNNMKSRGLPPPRRSPRLLEKLARLEDDQLDNPLF